MRHRRKSLICLGLVLGLLGLASHAGFGIQNTPPPSTLIYTWSFSEPTHIKNLGVAYLNWSGGGLQPVFDQDPDGRNSLKLPSPVPVAHSEMVIPMLGTEFNNDFWIAYDQFQVIQGDLVPASKAAIGEYTVRTTRIRAASTGSRSFNLRTRFKGETANGQRRFVLSGSSKVNGSWLHNEFPHTVGDHATHGRQRVMLHYNGGPDSQRSVDVYTEGPHGEYVLRSKNPISAPSTSEVTLRSRSGHFGGTPDHTIWLSNIAIARKADDAWNYRPNQTGTPNRPFTPTTP